jgi:hypothetical protein
MSSWRDSTSQQSQDDLDSLLNAVLPLAQRLLGESGEFYPFGADLTLSGETSMVMGHPGSGDNNPASSDVFDLLVGGFGAKSDHLRAAALVANFRTSESDVIRIDLEHRDGRALVVLMPYQADPSGQGISYGQLQAGEGNRRIWK